MLTPATPLFSCISLTGVHHVAKNYGKRGQRAIRELDVAEARALDQEGHFPEGSMGPKIRAAIEFVEHTGREVLITSAERLEAAIAGRAGTRIVAAKGPAARPAARRKRRP